MAAFRDEVCCRCKWHDKMVDVVGLSKDICRFMPPQIAYMPLSRHDQVSFISVTLWPEVKPNTDWCERFTRSLFEGA